MCWAKLVVVRQKCLMETRIRRDFIYNKTINRCKNNIYDGNNKAIQEYK